MAADAGLLSVGQFSKPAAKATAGGTANTQARYGDRGVREARLET